jgi:hypothetical protein
MKPSSDRGPVPRDFAEPKQSILISKRHGERSDVLWGYDAAMSRFETGDSLEERGLAWR